MLLGEPVWSAAGSPAPSTPPRRCDVLIVGGGISGVSALHWLRSRGLDAALVERDHLAAGASGRNAGFLLGGVAENYALAVERYGREVAREVWRFTALNHRLTRDLIGSADVGYVCRGSWTLAASGEEAVSLEAAAELLRQDGFPGAFTRDLPVPLQEHTAGLLNPDDAEVDPARLVRAIAHPHRDAIHTGVEVLAIEPGGGAVRVQHAAGETVAGSVVVAVNAWTQALLPDVDITPVRGQMCATDPETAVALDRPAYAHWGYRYWRQLADGRMICGGFRDRAVETEVGHELEATESVQRHIDDQLGRLGVAAPVQRRWAGTMGFSRDGLPLVGPLPAHPGVHLLGGYSGHGMGFAVHCARVLSAHMCDGAVIPTWLHAAR